MLKFKHFSMVTTRQQDRAENLVTADPAVKPKADLVTAKPAVKRKASTQKRNAQPQPVTKKREREQELQPASETKKRKGQQAEQVPVILIDPTLPHVLENQQVKY